MFCFRFLIVSLAVVLVFTLAGCGKGSTAEQMEQALHAASIGDWAETMKIAGAVTEEDPGDPSAWALAAIAAEHAGQGEVALENARRGAELCPDSFVVQYTYGRLLADRPGRENSAIQYLEKAYNLKPGSFDCLAIALQCAARLNMPQTDSYYQILAQYAPALAQTPEIQSSMGIYLLRTGNLRNGMEFLIKAFDAAQNNPVVTLNLARAVDRYIDRPASSTQYYQHYLDLTAATPEAAGVRTEVSSRVSELTRGNR